MVFLIILEIILLAILILAAIQFFNIVFRGFAPLFTTSDKVINIVLQNYKPKNNDTVYELGAGRAKFLQTVEKQFPQTKLIGIEYSWLTYFFSKWQLKKKGSHIQLLRRDLFKTNLQEANYIYCYLIVDMMEKLSQKLKTECRPGTIIASYMFSLPNLEIKKTIKDGNDVIYFYEI